MKRSLRPVDLARAAQVSRQTVRNYEAWGMIPPAERSGYGYRLYTARHLQAIATAKVMIAGYGWLPTLRIMRRVHRGDLQAALALVNTCHAALDHRLHEIEELLHLLNQTVMATDEAMKQASSVVDQPLTIGAAARSVGVRVSAVRYWEQRGLFCPPRDPSSGYRLYDADQVRQLRVVALLRRANYSFGAIQQVVEHLATGRTAQAIRAAEQQRLELTAASRCCVRATAAFCTYAIEEERRAE